MAKDTPQYRYHLRNREARNTYSRERARQELATPEGRAKRREQNQRSNDRLKAEVFDHYGRKCACCGESEFLFLTIDHVNNDGAEHRKTLPSPGYLYRWLRQNGFPEGFQALCMNCNWGKLMNRGICPHETPQL